MDDEEVVTRGKTKHSTTRLPIISTIRQGGEIFARVWWKLVLLSAVPPLLSWIITIFPSLGRHYPTMPSFRLAQHDFSFFLRRLLMYLPVDMAWITIYSWLDVAKISIVGNALKKKRPRKWKDLLIPHWRVWLGIVLLRLAVGWVLKFGGFITSLTADWALALNIVLTVLLYAISLSLCVLFVMMPFIVVLEKKEWGRSLRKSVGKTEPYFWRILAIIIIMAIPYTAFTTISSKLIVFLSYEFELYTSTALTFLRYRHADMVEMFYYSLGWCVLGSVYFNLRGSRTKKAKAQR